MRVVYQKFLQNIVVQQVSINHTKQQAKGNQMSDSVTGKAIVFYSFSTRHSAQASLNEGMVALHPCNLPPLPVAQPQTSRDYIMPPNHEAPATIGILVAAYRLVVGTLKGLSVSLRCRSGRMTAERTLER